MTAATSPSAGNSWDKIRRWIEARPQLALTLAVVAALCPFLAKSFNMDDPLFIWAAKQIQSHPGNPYGFEVNWYGTAMPMWEVTQNPPLACYYLALAAKISGWSEIALHCTFLFPAIAVILGTHRLARHFCHRPLLAALIALFTPVFLVSATTIMCDVLMLAFWTWAVVFWVEGTEDKSFWRLLGAACLVTMAALTKYFGVCLIPLLGSYSLASKDRKNWPACLYLLIPLAGLYVYRATTQSLYHYDLLSSAVGYAHFAKVTHALHAQASFLTTLIFTGGCLASAVFFAPLLWRGRTLATLVGSMACLAIILFTNGTILKYYAVFFETIFGKLVDVQVLLWATCGISVLMLVVTDIHRRCDPRSLLLILWVFGSVSFTAFFNWTINGRSLLPLVPAVGILIARRLEQNTPAKQPLSRPAVPACLAASMIFAMIVAKADYHFANAIRQTALQTCAKYASARNTLWFQGHWGFQYYMEASGALALDLKHSILKPGDILAIPENNTALFPVNPDNATLRDKIIVPSPALLATWSGAVGAGFYAATPGPLPFAFGSVPPESVSVYVMKTPATENPKN